MTIFWFSFLSWDTWIIYAFCREFSVRFFSLNCLVRSSRIRVCADCFRLITLPVSIDILQIHPHAQLAHWALVTLTTVVNHCWRTRLVNVLPTFWLFEPVNFLEKKIIQQNHKIFIPLLPNPCHAWVLNISRLISSSIYSNTPPSSDWIDIK